MKTEIRARALALGFDLVGVTSADPPPHANQFQQWLAAGFHGEMGYLARRADKRGNPTVVLPGARSIIVVGLNYYTGEAEGATARRELASNPIRVARPTGGGQDRVTAGTAAPPRLARYAWGSVDYHDVLGEKLGQLATFLTARGGQARWYVDTGPVLERDLAQRAGLGFIGKHTNLISRTRGNWIFLGAILTTLELEPDPPEREYCGTCRRCLEACPTRAIVAPYQLDARLCISYLTIELKGSIPVELRPLIGDRVFGCDDCLEVCPWNRFARLSPVRAFARRPLPALAEFLAWDDRRFRAFFRDTPIFRVKRRGFLRNVCVALGNVGDASVLPALAGAAQDPEPLVREHAAWAGEQIRSRPAARK